MSVTGVWDITAWDESVWADASVPFNPLLASYTELIAALIGQSGFLKDSGVSADQAKIFIRQAESKIQRDLLDKRFGPGVPAFMIARGTSSTDAQSGVTVPADHLKTRAIRVNGEPARYVSQEKILTNMPGYSDAPVSLDYYQRLPQLSDANPTNWLLTIAPDVYIWASCLQFVPWGKEEAVLRLWQTFYEDAMHGVKTAYAAQPRGSLQRTKGLVYRNFYTVIGSTLIFGGEVHRNSAAFYSTSAPV